MTRNDFPRLATAALALGLAAMTPQAPIADELSDAIAAVRAANEKYRDVNAALADGFILAPPGECVSAAAEGLPPEWGDMGIHYIHPGRMRIVRTEPRLYGEGLNTDFLEPSILLYEPQADGSLELVGVENVVFREAWEASGASGPPAFEGVAWDAMEGEHAHGFEAHYDLHVWAFRDNPAGVLKPFNPAVSCGG